MYRPHAMRSMVFYVTAAAAAVLLSGCGINLSNNAASSGGAVTSSQQRPLTAPTLGYVWDPATGLLRGINGVPGAAVLSTTGNIGSGFLTAAASASQGYALLLGSGTASSAKAGSLYLATLPGGSPRQLASGQWTSIVLSASGSYALAYSTASQTAVLVSGLPQQPAVQAINLNGAAQLLTAAVSDTGVALVATAADSSGSFPLFAVSSANSPRRVSSVGSAAGLAFIPATDTALAADATSGAIQKITAVGSSPAVTTLSGSGLPQSVGLDVTSDAHYAVVANAAGRFLRVDLTGQSPAAYAQCNCTPVTVSALTGSAVRFTAPGNGPIWIVNAGDSALKSLFIPYQTGLAATSVQPASKPGGAL